MSQQIALKRINEWKDGEVLHLSDLNLTELPREILTLTNLTFLNLYNNKIKDVTPIASLTNLTWLDLSKNKIKDVTHIGSLSRLDWLNLNNNNIQDVTPLASLTNCLVFY
jgi:Leucine-rich repeat (LRR) protein